MKSIPGRFAFHLRAALLLVAIALLTACATPYGGYGGSGVPGGAYPGSGYGSERLLGTVQQVDPGYGRLLITADAGGYGGSRPIELQFDRNTRLVYQGREYPVEGLERGDRISVDAVDSGGRLLARHIEVVQNVRETPGGGYYGGDLQGAVSYVDPRRRVIEITRGGYSGQREQVFYDERTQVEYRGQWLRPEQLEPGDVIRIQARPTGQDWFAERIQVEINARSR
jgi:hypothetical protein